MITKIAIDDPIARFNRWFSQEVAAGTDAPERMALATCGTDRLPSVRYVLLKEVDERGLCFYTDVRSLKGRQIAQNPQAALAFFWPRKGRQVRFEGSVERISAQQADEYWASRPLASRISASISMQSHPLRNREELVTSAAQFRRALNGKRPPRPGYWLGLRVVPRRIEFWVQAPARLHRRELFIRQAKRWRKILLQP